MTDLPKFYLPTVLILAILLCKAVNPPIFCLPKCCNNLPTFSTIKIFDHQSFVLHSILVYKLLRKVTAYTLAYSVFMMGMDAKVTPTDDTDDTDYSCHIKP